MSAKESPIQAAVRLATSKRLWPIWRNNNGAGKLENGSWVRWGLCNDSKALNENVKSSDLIGIRPVLITEDMVGTYIGQFCALECKPADWHYTGTDREEAQQRFIDIVNKNGGCAAFITDPEQLNALPLPSLK